MSEDKPMKITKHEAIAISEAISREVESHRTGYAVSSRTGNKNMVDFHREKIEILQSALEKIQTEAAI